MHAHSGTCSTCCALCAHHGFEDVGMLSVSVQLALAFTLHFVSMKFIFGRALGLLDSYASH